MSTEHCLVLITCGTDEEARAIAGHLVADRLAAGVQIIPMSSIYTWQGETVEGEEVLLIAKTRSARFEEIEAAVREMHSYDVPPIVQISIDRAHAPYLDWIDSETD